MVRECLGIVDQATACRWRRVTSHHTVTPSLLAFMRSRFSAAEYSAYRSNAGPNYTRWCSQMFSRLSPLVIHFDLPGCHCATERLAAFRLEASAPLDIHNPPASFEDFYTDELLC